MEGENGKRMEGKGNRGKGEQGGRVTAAAISTDGGTDRQTEPGADRPTNTGPRNQDRRSRGGPGKQAETVYIMLYNVNTSSATTPRFTVGS